METFMTREARVVLIALFYNEFFIYKCNKLEQKPSSHAELSKFYSKCDVKKHYYIHKRRFIFLKACQ